MSPRLQEEVLALSLVNIHDGEDTQFQFEVITKPCHICVKPSANCCRSMQPCFRQIHPIYLLPVYRDIQFPEMSPVNSPLLSLSYKIFLHICRFLSYGLRIYSVSSLVQGNFPLRKTPLSGVALLQLENRNKHNTEKENHGTYQMERFLQR